MNEHDYLYLKCLYLSALPLLLELTFSSTGYQEDCESTKRKKKIVNKLGGKEVKNKEKRRDIG